MRVWGRERHLGVALAEWRVEAGLSQSELARRISYHRTTVSHVERGAHMPAIGFWDACDAQLGAGGVLVGLFRAWRMAQRATLGGELGDEGGGSSLPGSCEAAGEAAGLEGPTDRRDVLKLGLAAAIVPVGMSRVLRESAAEVAELTRRAQSSAVGPAILEHLEQVVADLAGSYARVPPAALFEAVLPWRKRVAQLAEGPRTLPEAQELFTQAGWLSETLALLAHDLGDATAAYAYCNDAYEHAAQAGNGELCAWAMDAKATIGIYAGQPRKALAAAERALTTVPAGHPLAVSLHGQAARAAARLARQGRGGTEVSIAHLRRAEALYESLPAEVPTLFGLDTRAFASYNVHSRAASCYLALGRFAEARSSAEQALEVHLSVLPVDRSPTREALARVDLGMALAGLGEPEQACELGRQALASGRVVDSVLIRTAELGVVLTRRFPILAESQELVEQVQMLRAARA